MGREYVEDARRTGRPPDFSVQLRIQNVFDEGPLTSVRCSAEVTHTLATTVFSIWAEVFGPRLRHWRWVPHVLSDNQKLTGMTGTYASGRPDGCREAKVVKLLDW
jgi:hypothetical protein